MTLILINWRKIIGASLKIAGIGALIYLSAAAGYSRGYVDGSNSPINAVSKVTVLQMIRRGDLNKAISFLEQDLDVNIVYQWSLKTDGKSLLDIMGLGSHNKKFMQRVSTYRRHAPYKNENPDVEKAISTVLHQYSSGKKTN